MYTTSSEALFSQFASTTGNFIENTVPFLFILLATFLVIFALSLMLKGFTRFFKMKNKQGRKLRKRI